MMRGITSTGGILCAGAAAGVVASLVELPSLLEELHPSAEGLLSVLLALALGAVVGQALIGLLVLLLSLLFGLGPALSVDRVRDLVFRLGLDQAGPDAARRTIAAQPAVALACIGVPVGGFLVVRLLIERLNATNLKAAAVLLAIVAVVFGCALVAVNVARLLRVLLDRLGWPSEPLPLIVLWAPALVAAGIVSVVLVHAGLSVAETASLGWAPQLLLTAGLCVPAVLGVSAWPRAWPRWMTAVSALLPVVVLAVLGNVEAARRPLLIGDGLCRFGLGMASQATDVDQDGFGFLFGGADCAPLDPDISPAAREVPGNGVDENCSGQDGVQEEETPSEADEELLARVRRLFPVPPHILMITFDAARADHFSCYGYPGKTTPNMDRLAGNAALFLNAYSAGPNTHSSVPALLTGRNIFSVSLSIDKASRMMIRMSEDNVTIAELLHARGYRTAAVVSHRFFDKINRWNQGFDSWDLAVASRLDTVSSPLLAERAISVIRDHEKHHPGAPLFLWVHFYDPHANYVKHPEAPFRGSRSKGYDGELWFTDRYAGQVLGEARRKLGRNLVVVMSADHGEELGEHGRFGQHRSLHRENLWVPLIIQVPGLGAQRVPEPVSGTDIFPTLADIVGAEVPEEVRGESLLPGLIEGSMEERGPVFSEVSWRFASPPEHWVAVTDQSARMLIEVNSSKREVYLVEEDPYEQEDLAGAGLPEEAELEHELGRFLETTTVLTAETQSIP